MNTDRFLNRVWDKQEKKMLYPGDEFNHNHHGHSPYELVGINSRGLIALDPWKHEINIIPFGDRFIPMQCWGLPDKNKRLIYESDIMLDEEGNKIILVWRDGLFSYLDQKLNAYCSVWNYRFEQLAIIGNIYKQPELLEQNK